MADRIRGWWKQLRVLFDKGAVERELDEELAYHIERETEANVASGLDPAEARRRAELAFRGRERTKEEVRDARWTRVIEDAVADLRYGGRSLRKHPGFTVAAVLTLSLGMGGTATIVSAVKPVLFERLPYPGAGRIVAVTDVSPNGPMPVTFGTYREVVERSRSLESAAVVKPWEPVLSGDGRPERLSGQRVSGDYFRVLGVAPALGPGFGDADRAGGPDVAVIGHGLWRTRFGGDGDIVGRRVTLDGRPFTVVGVMPRDFESVTAPSARLWAPLQYDVSLPSIEGREWGHHLRMVARLLPGVTLDAAAGELDRIAGSPVAELTRPEWASLENGFRVTSLKESATGSARPTLVALLGAVVLLLLIACVNVANLLLARGARRREEFAMRAALGANRLRLVRQLLTESLLLAGLGAVGGLALAWGGVRAVLALSPTGLPRATAIRLDGGVFAVAAGVALVVGVAVGLAPALRAVRNDPRYAIARSTRTVHGRSVAGRTLVTAEVALTLILLVGAGLLLRSVTSLLAVDPGFDPAGTVALQVQVSGSTFRDDEAVHTFFDRALEQARALPGVDAAALTSQLPLGGQDDRYGVRPLEGAAPTADQAAGVFRYVVSPGYLEAMGVPLLEGRRFEDKDRGGPPVALISESLARSRFPGLDPVGRLMRVGGRPDWPSFTVVGVVGDVSQASLAPGLAEAVYLLPRHWYFVDFTMWLVVRTGSRPGALVPAIEDAVWSVDADQPVVRVATLDGLVAGAAAQQRFAFWVFQAFALVALALAAVGLSSLLAGSVAERRREIGVRCALGATRGQVLSSVLRQGLALAGLGVAIGVAGAAILTRALDSLLFGISRLDPVTYFAVIALVAAVALVASWLPARSAVRVDPSTALRIE